MLELYYAQKDGCKKHGDGHGKICLECVAGELKSRESAWQKERESLRGVLAAAAIAINSFTNTPAAADGDRKMVFRLDPGDFLQIREIEKFVRKTIAESAAPQPIPDQEGK